MENGSKNIFFKIGLTTTLVGLLLYNIFTIIAHTKIATYSLTDYGFPLISVIAAGLLIVAIILTTILIFMGTDKSKLLRTVIGFGGLYLLVHVLAELFAPFWDSGSWIIPSNILDYYIDSYQSFIGLLILGVISLFIFIFSMINMNKGELILSEKLAYIMLLGVIIVYDISCINWTNLLMVGSFYYGLFYIPFFLEIILLVAIIMIIVANITLGENDFVTIMGIIILNIAFIAIISTRVAGSVLDFTVGNDYIPLVLGNYILILGTVLTFIASLINIKNLAKNIQPIK